MTPGDGPPPVRGSLGPAAPPPPRPAPGPGELCAVVREISSELLSEYIACSRTILTSVALAVHENWMRDRPQYCGALARERLMAGAFVRAADYVTATRLRRRLTEGFHALFSGV